MELNKKTAASAPRWKSVSETETYSLHEQQARK